MAGIFIVVQLPVFPSGRFYLGQAAWQRIPGFRLHRLVTNRQGFGYGARHEEAHYPIQWLLAPKRRAT